MMYVYFWLVLVLGIVSSKNREFRIVLDTVTTKYWAPDVVQELNSVIVENNNRSYLSGNIILRATITKLDVTSKMDFWKRNNTKLRLYNLHADACSFLTIIHKNPFLGTLAKSFNKHTNVKLKCPFKQNFNYTLVNWYLDEQDLPFHAPEGAFLTNTEYFITKRKIFCIIVRGRVIYNNS